MPVSQPYAGSLGNLCLGPSYVLVGGTAIGDFNEVSVTVDATPKIIGGGYPKQAQAVVVDSMKASATVSSAEIGGPVVGMVNDVLAAIAPGGTLENKTVEIGLYYPLGGSGAIQFSGLMMPQFEINFTNGDNNSVKLFFEAIAGEDDTTLGTVVTGGGGGGGASFAPCATWMLSPDNMGVGMPSAACSLFTGQVMSATARLNTEFKRMEFGFPKLCRGLIPITTTLEIEFTTEELTSATVPLGTDVGPVSISALLVGGSSATFTANKCICTGGGPNMAKGDWSGTTFKFTAIQEGGVIGSYSMA